MAKKSFTNPTGTERKGLEALISSDLRIKNSEQKKISPSLSYTTSNVRVRNDFREKIYTLKGRTGKSITDIYNMIFEDYFNNNPL